MQWSKVLVSPLGCAAFTFLCLCCILAVTCSLVFLKKHKSPLALRKRSIGEVLCTQCCALLFAVFFLSTLNAASGLATTGPLPRTLTLAVSSALCDGWFTAGICAFIANCNYVWDEIAFERKCVSEGMLKVSLVSSTRLPFSSLLDALSTRRRATRTLALVTAVLCFHSVLFIVRKKTHATNWLQSTVPLTLSAARVLLLTAVTAHCCRVAQRMISAATTPPMPRMEDSESPTYLRPVSGGVTKIMMTNSTDKLSESLTQELKQLTLSRLSFKSELLSCVFVQLFCTAFACYQWMDAAMNPSAKRFESLDVALLFCECTLLVTHTAVAVHFLAFDLFEMSVCNSNAGFTALYNSIMASMPSLSQMYLNCHSEANGGTEESMGVEASKFAVDSETRGKLTPTGTMATVNADALECKCDAFARESDTDAWQGCHSSFDSLTLTVGVGGDRRRDSTPPSHSLQLSNVSDSVSYAPPLSELFPSDGYGLCAASAALTRRTLDSDTRQDSGHLSVSSQWFGHRRGRRRDSTKQSWFLSLDSLHSYLGGSKLKEMLATDVGRSSLSGVQMPVGCQRQGNGRRNTLDESKKGDSLEADNRLKPTVSETVSVTPQPKSASVTRLRKRSSVMISAPVSLGELIRRNLAVVPLELPARHSAATVPPTTRKVAKKKISLRDIFRKREWFNLYSEHLLKSMTMESLSFIKEVSILKAHVENVILALQTVAAASDCSLQRHMKAVSDDCVVEAFSDESLKLPSFYIELNTAHCDLFADAPCVSCGSASLPSFVGQRLSSMFDSSAVVCPFSDPCELQAAASECVNESESATGLPPANQWIVHRLALAQLCADMRLPHEVEFGSFAHLRWLATHFGRVYAMYICEGACAQVNIRSSSQRRLRELFESTDALGGERHCFAAHSYEPPAKNTGVFSLNSSPTASTRPKTLTVPTPLPLSLRSPVSKRAPVSASLLQKPTQCLSPSKRMQFAVSHSPCKRRRSAEPMTLQITSANTLGSESVPLPFSPTAKSALTNVHSPSASAIFSRFWREDESCRTQPLISEHLEAATGSNERLTKSRTDDGRAAIERVESFEELRDVFSHAFAEIRVLLERRLQDFVTANLLIK